VNEIIYTVIIPHKNIPDLLRRCLDSIPERDDIQIIIVDDSSDEDKVNFKTFPGLDRKNTEIYFTKENRGAGYARNVGLKHAKGKWLVFADADDFFMPCFSEALDKYKDDENDIIYFHVTGCHSDTMKYYPCDVKYINRLLSKIKRTNNWDLAVSVTLPWGKLIKRNMVENYNIMFQEVRYANDVFFSVRTAVAADKKTVSDYVFYCYTYRAGSLTKWDNLTKEDSLNQLLVRYQVLSDADYYLKSIGKKPYLYLFSIGYMLRTVGTDRKLFITMTLKFIKQYGLWLFIIGIPVRIYRKIKKQCFKN
jgi:glycosyltransferase involved in cell wall biosynthesis